jgi:hypothetical protein
MVGDILPSFLLEILVLILNVKLSLENKWPDHHTHLLYSENPGIPSKNWASPTEEVAKAVF